MYIYWECCFCLIKVLLNWWEIWLEVYLSFDLNIEYNDIYLNCYYNMSNLWDKWIDNYIVYYCNRCRFFGSFDYMYIIYYMVLWLIKEWVFEFYSLLYI